MLGDFDFLFGNRKPGIGKGRGGKGQEVDRFGLCDDPFRPRGPGQGREDTDQRNPCDTWQIERCKAGQKQADHGDQINHHHADKAIGKRDGRADRIHHQPDKADDDKGNGVICQINVRTGTFHCNCVLGHDQASFLFVVAMSFLPAVAL